MQNKVETLKGELFHYNLSKEEYTNKIVINQQLFQLNQCKTELSKLYDF